MIPERTGPSVMGIVLHLYRAMSVFALLLSLTWHCYRHYMAACRCCCPSVLSFLLPLVLCHSTTFSLSLQVLYCLVVVADYDRL